MKPKIVIVWFKRDLRLVDHLSIIEACNTNHPVLPLYIVEPNYWQQPFASRRHWHFIYDCLAELRQDSQALGQGLVVRVGETLNVLNMLAEEYDIHGIYAHEENGNAWTFERDKAVLRWCKEQNIAIHEYPSNGVVRRLQSRDDWSKIRNHRMAQVCLPAPKTIKPVPNIALGEIPEKSDSLFGEPVPGATQKGGRQYGLNTLNSFLHRRVKDYLYQISTPIGSAQSCSRLSPHIAWGTLSMREIIHATEARRKSLTEAEKGFKRPLSAFHARLAWRCHFVQKIEDQPAIEAHCMHPAFEGMRSEQNAQFLQAWQRGNTGYPFIDACMRNLIAEGWITFRMRAMLVSFASYHLWLDWRETGEYLARLFTDYEPGIHYSQLQMQSGVTGINTVRIYNPIKQSMEHDPKGAYIKHWLPALKNIPETWIHEPWLMPAEIQQQAGCIIGQDYPTPVVDHSTAIKHARQKISEIRKSDDYRAAANKVYQKLGSRKRSAPRKTAKKTQKTQLSLFD